MNDNPILVGPKLCLWAFSIKLLRDTKVWCDFREVVTDGTKVAGKIVKSPFFYRLNRKIGDKRYKKSKMEHILTFYERKDDF